MNDLDRELKDLFETKARSVDAGLVAPGAVLRRGRRRQIGIVAGGALGGVAALIVAGSLALALLGDGNDEVPSNQTPNGPYGDRTAIIGGFGVQAPEGWTLIDQWPLASIISVGSTSCTGSFSAVGDPVDGASEPTVARSTALGEEECTTEPASLPAGIPVLQLSTYDPGLMTPVCDVFDQGTGGTLPADGVAVFVTAFPGTKTPEQVQQALAEACPVAPDIDSIVQGPSVTYVTATFAGSDSDPALLGAAANVTDLGGHDTRELAPSPLSGPAYVIGSGVTGGERWQVSAGVDFSEGYLSTVWMTSFRADGSVTGTLAQPWSGGNAPVASALDVGDAAVAIALIPTGSGEPHWKTDTGVDVPLDEAPFPSSLAALTLKPVLDGTAAWAEVPDVSGAVVTELASPTG
ncbi:MAG: hypothetical protein WD096_06695 [Actinomycetota bacterium]